MLKLELVLSNTTTFFSGNLENLFKKAEKHGFKYLEILPYRWTNPTEVLNLEKKYNIQVVGIHLPPGKPKSLFEKILNPIWKFFLGKLETNPALTLAQLFKNQKRNFYVVCHADILNPKFFIENIPYHKEDPLFFWNPLILKKLYPDTELVFDPGHFETIPNYSAKLMEIYTAIKPEIIHISYGHFPPHILPNQKQQEELRQMLKIHSPKYIVLETNPLVSVKKGKEVLEKLIKYSHNDPLPTT